MVWGKGKRSSGMIIGCTNKGNGKEYGERREDYCTKGLEEKNGLRERMTEMNK
jgi:hypothetical protein